MEFTQLTESEFDIFSKQHPSGNFWQSVEMAHQREWNGWSSTYIGVREKGTLIAAAFLSYRPAFLSFTYAQILRGFLIDYENEELLQFFHKNLIVFLKSIHCLYVKMDPYVCYKERDNNGDLVENGFDHQNIVKYLKNLGYLHGGFLRGSTTDREPNWMFVCDLKDKDEDTLWKQLDHQTRWSINKTLKMGIRLREVDRDELPALKRMMEMTAKRRGFEDRDQHYYEGLFKNFKNDDHLKVVFAELDLKEYQHNILLEQAEATKELTMVEEKLQEVKESKKYNKRKKVILEQLELIDKKLKEIEELREDGEVLLLAVATFMLFNKEILYLYSGADERYMKFNGPYAIQWYMLTYGMRHGYERYNFYGISGVFDRNAEEYGIYEFKKGFTGHVEELIGEFTYIVNPIVYRFYTGLRGIKHRLHK